MNLCSVFPGHQEIPVTQEQHAGPTTVAGLKRGLSEFHARRIMGMEPYYRFLFSIAALLKICHGKFGLCDATKYIVHRIVPDYQASLVT